jgi:hypothetical protein
MLLEKRLAFQNAINRSNRLKNKADFELHAHPDRKDFENRISPKTNHFTQTPTYFSIRRGQPLLTRHLSPENHNMYKFRPTLMWFSVLLVFELSYDLLAPAEVNYFPFRDF